MRTVARACIGAALFLSACSSDTDPGTGVVPGGQPPTVAPPPTVQGTAGAAALPMNPVQPPVNPVQPPVQPPPNQMMPTMMPPPVEMPPPAGNGLAMDECNLNTQWPGDEYCILPPPADKGFQMHIGPSNYDNPEPRYVMEPDSEITETFSGMTGNTTNVYYYWRQYRMRPGSHHLIVNSTGGRRLGGTQNLAKDNPERGMIADENKGVGMMLAPRSPLSNSLHYYNFTDKPIIKQVWVNFWYRDAEEVTEPANEIFSMLGMGIQPGQRVIKHGSCPVTGTGRILTLYGHVHSHNKRFSAWRKRGSEKMLVHESYSWEHPGVSEFSSNVMNPVLNPAGKVAGGYSGVLDVKQGDTIEFECDILNDTNSVFVGQNEAQDDEMCILIGDSVGTSLSPFCAMSDLPATGQ